MLRKFFLFVSVFFLISQYHFGQSSNTKLFKKYGISFKYSNQFAVKDAKKDGYDHIYLKSTGATVTIQIFPKKIDDSFKKVYLNALKAL